MPCPRCGCHHVRRAVFNWQGPFGKGTWYTFELVGGMTEKELQAVGEWEL